MASVVEKIVETFKFEGNDAVLTDYQDYQ
jgi:hypothetical protein